MHRFEIPARTEDPAVRGFSSRDFDRDVPRIAAQAQRVVARRESLDDEEAAVELHLRRFIRGECPPGDLEQRDLLPQPVHRGGSARRKHRGGRGHAHSVAGLCVNLVRPCALEVFQIETPLTRIRCLRRETADARKRAECHATCFVRA